MLLGGTAPAAAWAAGASSCPASVALSELFAFQGRRPNNVYYIAYWQLQLCDAPGICVSTHQFRNEKKCYLMPLPCKAGKERTKSTRSARASALKKKPPQTGKADKERTSGGRMAGAWKTQSPERANAAKAYHGQPFLFSPRRKRHSKLFAEQKPSKNRKFTPKHICQCLGTLLILYKPPPPFRCGASKRSAKVASESSDQYEELMSCVSKGGPEVFRFVGKCGGGGDISKDSNSKEIMKIKGSNKCPDKFRQTQRRKTQLHQRSVEYHSSSLFFGCVSGSVLVSWENWPTNMPLDLVPNESPRRRRGLEGLSACTSMASLWLDTPVPRQLNTYIGVLPRK